MPIKRIPIETVADPAHRSMYFEGDESELLPVDRVYIDPISGSVRDGCRGHRLGDLHGHEIEIPRTTWYGS
jgi:hypothetical protein